MSEEEEQSDAGWLQSIRESDGEIHLLGKNPRSILDLLCLDVKGRPRFPSLYLLHERENFGTCRGCERRCTSQNSLFFASGSHLGHCGIL